MIEPWKDDAGQAGRSWMEQRELDEVRGPRERNPDSSVSAQYEDHTLPDIAWQHEDES